ncbi:hypothetical protein [Nonomuraea sp. SBT364]|uniref:hypothetical protein n=1 Tax=Nonomuraea sp. SBT364 TaxID=1580530 RepID=UPI0012E2BAA6|nr:hypothetical protein [Nonomuraea sp. SBT364]
MNNTLRNILISTALAAAALSGTAVSLSAVQPGEQAVMISSDGHPGATPNPNDWV